MDKFEMEQLHVLGEYIDELQNCFIDGDAYSRVPSLSKWRAATRTVHRLKLAFCELKGYASAIRQCNVVSIRERLTALSEEGGEISLKEKPDVGTSDSENGFVEFTEKEILKMPRKFRKLFRTNKQTAHVRRKDGDVYEIRMQIDGHRISASAKFLDVAKERFIKKLRKFNEQGATKTTETSATITTQISVADYALHYLETFKKPNISEKHFSNLCGIVRRHIARFFGETLMRDLTATDCQQLLNELSEQGKGRTVEEIKNLLSWICAAAVADRILPADVMSRVQTLPHRRTAGKSIPREYVRAFLQREPQDRAELCLRLLVYTGMRPCELSALTFDEKGFVAIATAKRKKWETKDVRRIPLHSALAPYIQDIRAALPVALVLLERAFRKHFPGEYRLYDLRHTFTTIAQQAHCYKSWVDYATGHKANGNTTDNVYTHWEDDWQRSEMEKIEF